MKFYVSCIAGKESGALEPWWIFPTSEIIEVGHSWGLAMFGIMFGT